MKFHAYWLAGAASLAVVAAVAGGCNDAQTSQPDLMSEQHSGKTGRSLLDLPDPIDPPPPPPPPPPPDTTTVNDPFSTGLEATEEPCAECIGGDPAAEVEIHMIDPPVKSTKLKLKHITTGDNKSKYETTYHYPTGANKSKKVKLIFEHIKTGQDKSRYICVQATAVPSDPTGSGLE